MIDYKKHENTLSYNKPPIIIWFCSFLFVFVGIITSPEFFITTGVMAQSLTSNIESVKRIALLEVRIISFSSIFFGMALMFSGLFWSRIMDSSFIRSTANINLPDWVAKSTNRYRSRKTTVIGLICLVISLLYILFGNYVFDTQMLYSINQEDGLLENLTAIFFLFCSIIAIIIAIKYDNYKAGRIIHIVFAFGFFMLAGEEISWGQRFFGIDTIKILVENNVQNENNLHNLLGYAADHLAILIVFIYGTLFAFLAKAFPFFRKLFFRLGIPIASLGVAWGFLFASLIHKWTIGQVVVALPGLRFPEIREVLTGIMFLLLMIQSFVSCKNSQ